MSSSIFANFPKTDSGVVNTTIRIDFFNKIKENNVLYEFVQIKNGQTPEQLAYEIYEDPQLYWIILVVNDIDDLYTGWCMSDEHVFKYTQDKYGLENIYNIHHYEDSNGDWTNSVTTNPISYLTYEQNLNEDKRKIKILKKEYIPQVLAELKSELRKTL